MNDDRKPLEISRRDLVVGAVVASAVGPTAVAREADLPLTDRPEMKKPLTEGDMTTPLWVRIDLTPEGNHPGLMDITPDNRFALVPCQDTDNLIVIDVATLKKIKMIPLEEGATPWMAKFAPDGSYALVSLTKFDEDGAIAHGYSSVSSGASSVAVIDSTSWEVVRRIEVGAGPNGIAFTNDGSRAFVSNVRSNTVSVIETGTWTVSRSIPVGAGPLSLYINEARSVLVVTNFEGASLSVIDLATLAVTHTIPVGNPTLDQPNPEFGRGDTTEFEIGPDGKGYAANWRSHDIAVVDLNTGVVTDRISSPIQNPFGVRTVPGRTNDLFIFSNLPTLRVSLFDPTAKMPLATVDITGHPFIRDFANHINYWINDPDNHALAVYMPGGLEGLTQLANIPFSAV